MPMYEYRCRECGHELEIRQKFSDDPLRVCPHCGAEQGLFRVVQPAGVVFKGSGFYVNDSRGNKDNLTTPTAKKENGSHSDNGTSDGSSKSTESSAKSESKTPEKSASEKAAS